MPSGKSNPPVPPGSRAALFVLVALVVLSPWPFGSAHPVTVWLISLACLLTAGAAALLGIRRRESLEMPRPAAWLCGLFVLGLVQLLPLPQGLLAFLAPGSASVWYPDEEAAAAVLGAGPRPVSIWPEATRRAIAFGLAVTSLAVAAVPALRERRHLVRSAAVVVASGVAVAAYGLVARLVFGDRLYGMLAVPTITPFGPFVSKNHFAGYVEMAALLSVGLAVGLADEARRAAGPLGWIGGRHASRVVLAAGAAATMALGVLVSLSRGGAVSLGAGVLAFVWLRWWSAGRTSDRAIGRIVIPVAVVAAGIGVLLAIPPEARERLRSIGDGVRDSSTAFRGIVWADSLRLFATSPAVGHGLGTFADALPRLKRGAGDVVVEHAESDYLELAAEGGLAGVGLVLAAGTLFLLGAHASVEGASRLRRGLSHGATGAAVALGVHSVVDFNLRIPSNALLFSFVAAAALASRPPVRSPRRATVLAALGVAGILVLPSSPRRQSLEGLGAIDGLRSRSSATPLRARDTRAHVERYLRQRPADAEAWVWLSWSHLLLGHSDEARALARYGARLDPQRRGLGEAAGRLSR